jgi:hypothetical protein
MAARKPPARRKPRYRVVCYELIGENSNVIMDDTSEGFIAATGTITRGVMTAELLTAGPTTSKHTSRSRSPTTSYSPTSQAATPSHDPAKPVPRTLAVSSSSIPGHLSSAPDDSNPASRATPDARARSGIDEMLAVCPAPPRFVWVERTELRRIGRRGVTGAATDDHQAGPQVYPRARRDRVVRGPQAPVVAGALAHRQRNNGIIEEDPGIRARLRRFPLVARFVNPGPSGSIERHPPRTWRSQQTPAQIRPICADRGSIRLIWTPSDASAGPGQGWLPWRGQRVASGGAAT